MRQWRILGMAVAAMAAAFPQTTGQGATLRVLADWRTWPLAECAVAGGEAAPGNDGWLKLTRNAGASVALRPTGEAWDLSRFAEIAVPVRNLGKANVRVVLRVDDGALATPERRRWQEYESLVAPGADPVWLTVYLGAAKPSPLAPKFVSMVMPPPEFVRRGTADGAHITRIALALPGAAGDESVSIGPIVARGVPAPLANAGDRAFPFVDEFGQFIHRDWATKIHTPLDFTMRRNKEAADLAAHARPADWDRWGGWAQGPQRKATGYFRVEKIDGVWWMVDPDGRLFWSHGVVRVGTRVRVGGIYHGTPLPDREHYFKLPAKGTPMAAFFGTEPQSTRGYYVGRDNHAIYDHLEANLFRKYGAKWAEEYAAQSQRRLASWGLNTIANSSDPGVYLRRQTPYTAIVYSAPMGKNEFRIQGSKGNWGKLPDPFDPGWYALMEKTLQTDLKESLKDPWCLGFFVDNELAWGDTMSLGEVTLASPKAQYAKIAFVADLKKKYGEIAKLNEAWGTAHASWDALLESTTPPDRKRPMVKVDLVAFSEHLLDAYFGGCRRALREAAPNHMYLGCRFAGHGNELVLRIAARYVDIMSINRYTRTLDDLTLPAGVDRPIVIGEFHSGAWDAPTFAAGLIRVANQDDRAQHYRIYVDSALRHPAVVGTHWFQYFDQPTTGRFDGENYNAGLLDICDTPYQAMVEACRKMGASFYRMRGRK